MSPADLAMDLHDPRPDRASEAPDRGDSDSTYSKMLKFGPTEVFEPIAIGTSPTGQHPVTPRTLFERASNAVINDAGMRAETRNSDDPVLADLALLRGAGEGGVSPAIYGPGDPALRLAPDLHLPLPPETVLSAATVRIEGVADGHAEVVMYDLTGTRLLISHESRGEDGTIVFHLLREDTAANYLKVLSSLRYLNREVEPSGGERVVQIEAADLTGTIIPLHTVSLMVVAPIPVRDAEALETMEPPPTALTAALAVEDGTPPLDRVDSPETAELPEDLADTQSEPGRELFGVGETTVLDYVGSEQALLGKLAAALTRPARRPVDPVVVDESPEEDADQALFGDIHFFTEGMAFLGTGVQAFRPAGEIARPGERVKVVASDDSPNSLFAADGDYWLFTAQPPRLAMDPLEFDPVASAPDAATEAPDRDALDRDALDRDAPTPTMAADPAGADIVMSDLFESNMQDFSVYDHTRIDFSRLDNTGAGTADLQGSGPAAPAHASFAVALPSVPALDDTETPTAA